MQFQVQLCGVKLISTAFTSKFGVRKEVRELIDMILLNVYITSHKSSCCSSATASICIESSKVSRSYVSSKVTVRWSNALLKDQSHRKFLHVHDKVFPGVLVRFRCADIWRQAIIDPESFHETELSLIVRNFTWEGSDHFFEPPYSWQSSLCGTGHWLSCSIPRCNQLIVCWWWHCRMRQGYVYCYMDAPLWSSSVYWSSGMYWGRRSCKFGTYLYNLKFTSMPQFILFLSGESKQVVRRHRSSSLYTPIQSCSRCEIVVHEILRLVYWL